MAGSKIRAMQTEGVDRGKLQVNVTGSRRHRPIPNARIQLSYTADPETELEELDTNESGQTEQVTLPTPPLEYSMQPGEQQPYAEYTVQVVYDPGNRKRISSGQCFRYQCVCR